MVFRERCLDSLYEVFEECNKRQDSLEHAKKEASEKCEEDTQVLQRRADQLDNSLQNEIDRLDAHREEALSAVQKAADARTKQIQWKIHALKEQANLEIARIRISSPGRWLSDEITAAECYAANGDPMKEARSRYLSAYEEVIKTHEASLMAEDMELVALHLSWRTERLNSMEKCKLDLDEKWAQRIQLCRQRATPVRRAYKASKKTCKEDLKTGYAAAAKELSKRQRQKAHLNEGGLDPEIQKHVDAITKKCDEEIARLQVQMKEIEEKRDRHAKELRSNHEAQYSTLMDSVRTLKKSLSFTIKERQALLGRECGVISKDLRAVQATLTLIASAIHTLGQDPTSRPGSRMCPCGCGGPLRPDPSHDHRDQRPKEPSMGSFPHFSKKFRSDSHQRTYERFEEQWRADESRRQREVHEEAQRYYAERLKREREARRRKEEAEEQAKEARARFEREQREEQDAAEREEQAHRKREERRKAERDARARFEREQARAREEEDARKREEARHKREDERRRKIIEQKKKKSVGKGRRKRPRSKPKRKRGAGKAHESARRKSPAGRRRKDGVAKTRIGRNTINSNRATPMEEGMREVLLKKVPLTTTTTPEERVAVLLPKGGQALSTNAGPSTQKCGLDSWLRPSQK